MTRRVPGRAVWAASALLLAGCSLQPAFQPPALPVAATYPALPASRTGQATLTVAADLLGWRDFIVDPRLRRIEAIALRSNRDLRTAVLDIAQAQAQFRIQRANLFPRLDLSGGATYEGLSDSGLIGAGAAGGGAAGAGGTTSGGGTLRYYSASVGITSYELDLFGRLRSLSRQAFESYLAQVENRRSVQLTVVSSVATDYLTLLADQELLAVTQDTLRTQRETERLSQAEFDHGTLTLLDLRQVQTSVATAEANSARYTRQVAQDQNALVLEIGAPFPADLPAANPLGAQTLTADLPAGLPSDLLARRPDIMKAEHTLRGAYADIGAARAAFFPQITLTASDGLQSLKLNQLFTAGATTWSFAPQITVPIFTWGQNRANLDLAKIERDLDIVAYEQAIQTAFEEVSNALVARGTYVEQTRALRANLEASTEYYRLADMRFRTGVDTYLTTLDAQRTLYSARQTLISAEAALLQNLVTLYRTLGGGWNEHSLVAKQAEAGRNLSPLNSGI